MKRRPCPIIRDRQVPTGHRSDSLYSRSTESISALLPGISALLLLGTAGSVCAVSAAADAAPGMTDHMNAADHQCHNGNNRNDTSNNRRHICSFLIRSLDEGTLTAMITLIFFKCAQIKDRSARIDLYLRFTAMRNSLLLILLQSLNRGLASHRLLRHIAPAEEQVENACQEDEAHDRRGGEGYTEGQTDDTVDDQ